MSTTEFERSFANVFEEGKCNFDVTLLREIVMLRLMDSITDKADWHIKISNEDIVEKYAAEAYRHFGQENGDAQLERNAIDWEAEYPYASDDDEFDEDARDEVMYGEGQPQYGITPAMMKWVFDELKWRTNQYAESGIVESYVGGVMKVDWPDILELLAGLKQYAAILEAVPKEEADWHPGSNNCVLDLVHPSLFPLMYGVTRISSTVLQLSEVVSSRGENYTIAVDVNEELSSSWSKQYQWLPCNFSTSDAKITSYINNLHPEHHKSLYGIIEQAIVQSIPLWNRTCERVLYESEDWVHANIRRIPIPGHILRDEQYRPVRLDAEKCSPEEWTTFIGDAPDFATSAWLKHETDSASAARLDLKTQFSKLQVIVKLANIHLTPEQPTYEGGSWHVEGMMNERIIATSLLYYDMDNVTESRLAFRMQVDAQDLGEDLAYEQGQFRFVNEIFGMLNDEAAVQELGSVLCKEGRMISFPNVLQHRVEPFSLLDKTKKGHRKILALFLCDPTVEIMSTERVAPQRKDWWQQELMNGAPNRLHKLPQELKNQVFTNVDYPLSMDEAKEVRLRLMEERKHFVGKHTSDIFGQSSFSLCEH